MGETDPAATLAGHATAPGTFGPTKPTSLMRVVDVLALVSNSDGVRTALAGAGGDVLRRDTRG